MASRWRSSIQVLALVPLLGAAATEPAEPPPNILVLLIDDLGLEGLSLYDAENLYPLGIAGRLPQIYPKTPNIDRLAREGVRFTQARVMPSCSATRASLLSGRYPFRHRIGAIVRSGDSSPEYERSEVLEFGVGEGNREWTLAHLARAAGYSSFLSGKWHLALTREEVALDGEPGYGWAHVSEVGGFDDYWAVWGNLPGRFVVDGRRVKGGYSTYVACENGAVEIVSEYATSAQVDRLIEWIVARGEDEPWFALGSFNAVHDPYDQPPRELVATEAYFELADETRGKARGRASKWPPQLPMVEALDQELGRLIESLEERGLLERTLIFLLSDNGTPQGPVNRIVEQDEFDLGTVLTNLVRGDRKRFKHSIWEPGVRVPFIVRGPGVVAPGRTSGALVDVVDLWATVVEILGGDFTEWLPGGHRTDGISFLPLLRSPEAEPERRFSFVEHFEPNGNPELIEFEPGRMGIENMLRRAFVLETDSGRFKLVRNLDHLGDGRDLLFQLSDAEGRPIDPWEQSPLSTAPGEAHHGALIIVQQAMEGLLASEERNWR